MHRKIPIAGLIAVLSAILLFPSPLLALDRASNPLSVSTETQVDEKSYPGLIGVYKYAPVSGLGDIRTVERCRQVTYCDTVPLKISVPKNSLYQLVMILSWPGPDKKDSDGRVIRDPEGRTQKENDLDLFLRDIRVSNVKNKDGTTSSSTTQLELGRKTTIWQPEIMGFGDLPPSDVPVTVPPQSPSEVERTETHSYFLTPANFNGSNESYTLKVVYSPTKLDSYDFDVGGRTITYKPPSGKSSRPLETDTRQQETLEPVKTPGSDGPVEEKDLVALKAEQAADTSGVNPWWIAISAAVLVVGAAVLLFYLRTRRRAA